MFFFIWPDNDVSMYRELAFFFPDFVAPNVEGKGKLQRTLALIRPDVYQTHKGKFSIILVVYSHVHV